MQLTAKDIRSPLRHEAVVRPKSLAASGSKAGRSFSGLCPRHDPCLGLRIRRDGWVFAREHGYTLVTKDSDFHELSLLRGAPPRVVWIRLGNCTTHQIEAILRKHSSDIQSLIENPEAEFLLLY